MKLSFLKHKWQKVTFWILSSIALLLLILGLLINFIGSPILANTVKNTVLSSSDSLYTIDFTKADLHVMQGKIVLFNIDLKPDTAVYNKLKKIHMEPNNLYRLHIKKLALTHIHPFRLYFKRKLDIGEIVLSAPELNISYQLNHTKDTTEKDKRTLYQRISKTLRSIHVSHISLNDIKFKYEDYSGNKVNISELKEMDLSATDLLIDSASMTDKSRFLYCRDVITEINNFSGITLNGLYKYKMKLLTLSTRTAQLNAQDVNIQPASPGKFFDKSKHDRFTAHIDSLQLNHFDFLSYHKYRVFNASSLVLSKGRLGVFAHPHMEPKPNKSQKERSATFPNAGIYRLKTDLKIDTVLLDRIDVTYTELSRKSHKTGFVTFNNTSGRILNLTTNAAALQKNKICSISLVTYFMSKGKLDVNFNFNMADKNLAYDYKGHLGPLNLSAVNPATMPLGMVKITGGKLKSFDFNINANRDVSRGRVSLLYNDLKVTLLKADTNKNELKRMTIETFFANVFILKHNNPDNPGEAPRSFYVNDRRPPNDAFFKTVWKTLLTGIKSCVGYGEQKEKEVQTQMAERMTNKGKRQMKRAARKQKRAEKKREKELKKEQGA